MKHFLFDLGDAAQWVLGVALVAWIIQYTIYAPWWNNPLGRSIVWLALSFEAVLVPSMFTLADPRSRFIGSSGYDYLEIANLTLAACVVLARIWAFHREHSKGNLIHNPAVTEPPEPKEG